MLDHLVVRGVEGVWERWERTQQRKISQGVFADLFSLECRINLELLELLSRQDSSNAPLAGHIAKALHFEVMEQLFTRPDAAQRVIGTLSGHPEVEKAGGVRYLRNVFARGMAIQQIARLQANKVGLTGVSLIRRLKNLKRDLIRIRKALRAPTSG